MDIEIRTDIKVKDYFPDSKYMIVYVFSLGDMHYFKFSDPFNMPPERVLSSVTYYRELEQNVTRPYLLAYCEAVENNLSPTQERPTIEVGEALYLTRMLKRKANMPKDIELMYLYASVVYFSQDERPDVYEYSYSKNKIAYWRKESSLRAFFGTKDILQLIPYLVHAKENLEAFNQVNKEFNQEFFSRIRGSLSSNQLTTLNASNDLYAEARTLASLGT